MATRQLQTPIAARWAAAGGRWATRSRRGWRRSASGSRCGCRSRWAPGIALWLALPTAMHWIGALLALSAGALAGLLIGWQRRFGRSVVIGCGVVAAGMLLIWGRALWVAAPVLAHPVTTSFSAQVERVDAQPARGQVRLIVRPYARADLPPRLRVTASEDQAAGGAAGRTDRAARRG